MDEEKINETNEDPTEETEEKIDPKDMATNPQEPELEKPSEPTEPSKNGIKEKVNEDVKSIHMAKISAEKDLRSIHTTLKALEKATKDLEKASEDFHQLSEKMSGELNNSIQEEFKKIVTTADANFMVLEKKANDWHKQLFKKHETTLNYLIISMWATPIITIIAWYIFFKK